MLEFDRRSVWRGLLQSITAVICGTLIVSVGLMIVGRNPIPVLTGLVVGAFGDPYRFAEGVGRSCPLLFCGLALSLFLTAVVMLGVAG